MNEDEKKISAEILKDFEQIRDIVNATISQLQTLLGMSHGDSIKQQIQQKRSEMLSRMEELKRKAMAQTESTFMNKHGRSDISKMLERSSRGNNEKK